MALELSTKLKNALKEDIIQQQIIAEIEGIDYVFGTNHVTEPIKIGDDISIGDDDFIIGGNKVTANSLPLINHKKISRSITQRISESEGISSITSMDLALIDEDGLISSMLSPTDSYDILGSECSVYAGMIGGSHPDDSIIIFKGIISGIKFESTNVILKVVHPEKLKQQTLFVKTETVLTSAINDSVTTIPVTYKETLLQPLDSLECYVRINDEIIKHDGFFAGNLIDCTRGALNTIAQSHEIGDTVETFYVLKGNPIDLTLKLLLSKNSDDSYYYKEDLKVSRINQIDANTFSQNSIVFDRYEFEKLNVQLGDKVQLQNVDDAGGYPTDNIFSQQIVTEINSSDSHSWIKVDKFLVTDTSRNYSVNLTSKYSTLTDGCGVNPSMIDIEGMNRIKNLYDNQLVDCEIYIKDTIDNAKEFIDKVILRAQGLLSVPRKGRISINKTSAPLADNNTVTLNKDNITNVKSLGIERSLDNGFYNSVIFKTTEDSLEDKFLRTDIFLDEDSEKKINVGKRPLIIEARSIRDNANTRRFIEIHAENLLNTYKFAAEKIEVQTDYPTGIPIEVGDSVISDLSGLNVTDISTASKSFIPRVMRVLNKNLDLIGNKVTLSLESTIFKSNGRYGTISPSSNTKGGSTTSLINLAQSYGNTTEYEKEKWTRYIGEKVRIRSNDWTISDTTTLLGVDTILDQLIVEPIPMAPLSGFIVDPPKYDDSDPIEMALWKSLHVFLNPSVSIVSASDDYNFTVDPSDIDKFLINATVKIRNTDLSEVSEELKVTEINTNTITVDSTIGFTPDSSHTIELIGFKDGGQPYRIL